MISIFTFKEAFSLKSRFDKRTRPVVYRLMSQLFHLCCFDSYEAQNFESVTIMAPLHYVEDQDNESFNIWPYVIFFAALIVIVNDRVRVMIAREEHRAAAARRLEEEREARERGAEQTDDPRQGGAGDPAVQSRNSA